MKQKERAESGFKANLRKDLRRNYKLYLLLIPVILYYLLFCYKPMYGALIAFQEYSPFKGMSQSEWVGFRHFQSLFKNPDFPIILRNTLTISISSLLIVFPSAIVLALLFNELRAKKLKTVAQTLSYLPHFISAVVVCGMVKGFVSRGGFILQLVTALGGPNTSLLSFPEYFVSIYIGTELWQTVGWSSIIYLAALSGIDEGLYEAAEIDGAGKLRQVWHITIPGIMPTIIIMLILAVGGLLSVGHEKILLLYNPNIYETADVINSYVYRIGLTKMSWSYSSAVGLLNSVVNFTLVIATNALSRKYTETSLW